MALYCELENIITESDVEQKFIYPFLKAETPIGLGLKDSEILTKHILRKKLIDKGQKQKYYFPDYLVAIRGIPTLILEAKAPNELLANGYSEARLYAQNKCVSVYYCVKWLRNMDGICRSSRACLTTNS